MFCDGVSLHLSLCQQVLFPINSNEEVEGGPLHQRMLGSVLAQRCLDLLLLDLIIAVFGVVESGLAALKRAGLSVGAWRGRARQSLSLAVLSYNTGNSCTHGALPAVVPARQATSPHRRTRCGRRHWRTQPSRHQRHARPPAAPTSSLAATSAPCSSSVCTTAGCPREQAQCKLM